MDNKIIITVARQYGSGGRIIGEMLAKKLNIPFYDKSIIHHAAMESGIAEELFEAADEKTFKNFWQAPVGSTSMMGNHLSYFYEVPMNDKLFIIQSQIIKKLAEKSSCVIVGRCADYILRNEKNIVSVFVYSANSSKLERIVNNYGIKKEDAEDIMHKTDKRRAAYYNYYTGEKWGSADNYDISINSGSIGLEGTVEIVKSFAELKLKVSL